jgi:hypothetical protein
MKQNESSGQRQLHDRFEGEEAYKYVRAASPDVADICSEGSFAVRYLEGKMRDKEP